jgi:hypothetical protein
LFAACSKKFCFDEGIFLVESIQERGAVIDIQRSVPDHLSFFFGTFDKTRLSRSLTKSPAPREKFEDECQQNTLTKQRGSFLHLSQRGQILSNTDSFADFYGIFMKSCRRI